MNIILKSFLTQLSQLFPCYTYSMGVGNFTIQQPIFYYLIMGHKWLALASVLSFPQCKWLFILVIVCLFCSFSENVYFGVSFSENVGTWVWRRVLSLILSLQTHLKLICQFIISMPHTSFPEKIFGYMHCANSAFSSDSHWNINNE